MDGDVGTEKKLFLIKKSYFLRHSACIPKKTRLMRVSIERILHQILRLAGRVTGLNAVSDVMELSVLEN